jgi:hypothetical protein
VYAGRRGRRVRRVGVRAARHISNAAMASGDMRYLGRLLPGRARSMAAMSPRRMAAMMVSALHPYRAASTGGVT